MYFVLMLLVSRQEIQRDTGGYTAIRIDTQRDTEIRRDTQGYTRHTRRYTGLHRDTHIHIDGQANSQAEATALWLALKSAMSYMYSRI